MIFFGDRSHSLVLGAIATGAAASDLLDGAIARRTHSASQLGRWLDNLADIVFILLALSCEAYIGALPVYLPVLVGASFAQYAIDSILISGSTVPVKSRLGHYGGICNYIIVIVLAWVPPPRLPGALLRGFAPIIALFYMAAMGERILAYRLMRRCSELATIKPAAGE